jgi:glycerol-3-phosphate dehydrogenase (NAD(P)+)
MTEINEKSRIAIIGSGSWATALAKLLAYNVPEINWFIRKQENIDLFKKFRHNPNYLRSVEFDISRINFYNDINKIVEDSDILVFVTPSAFLRETLRHLTAEIGDKFVVSAIKGIIPEENLLVGEFFHEFYDVPFDQFGVIAGPCHAEEVARDLLSYLTIASPDVKRARQFAMLLESNSLRTHISDDIWGTEYSAVLKNIMAIASGISHSLRYGDNFQAVLMSNAIQEIKRFVDTVHPITRDIKSSAYLGDLLVTGYSQFSRNRTFGTMIGKGYTVRSAMLEMDMIAEGYYATKCIKELNQQYHINMPITDAVYNIIYENISPAIEIRLLTEHLR